MPAAVRLLPASALIAALALSACGGGGSDSPSAATIASGGTTSAAKLGDPARQPQPQKPRRRRPAAGELCQSQIGGFIGSMDSLRRRLAVGVTYEQYVDEVHGVRSTYRHVPAEELQLDCVGDVGLPAEHAFNRYIKAANAWGGCVSESGCDSAQVEPVLQRQWRVASHLLSEAETGLRAAS